LDLAIFQTLADIALSFTNLVDRLGVDGMMTQVASRATGGDDVEAKHCE
jgi:hypothetical protein